MEDETLARECSSPEKEDGSLRLGGDSYWRVKGPRQLALWQGRVTYTDARVTSADQIPQEY